MICLRSIEQLKYDRFDEIWLIVRSVGKAAGMLEQSNVKHVPVLSPSKELFFSYLNWKKRGIWNLKCFMGHYVPRFLKEMQAGPEPAQWLERLRELDKAGKKIALVCFCKEEELCHRSIVGALCSINGMGVEKPDIINEYVERYFPL